MAVRIYLEESARRFETGVRELEVLGGFKLAGDGVPVRWSEAGVPGISWDGSRAQLSGAGEAQFFRGLGLLRERLAGGAAPFEQTVGFSSDINFIRVFKKLENRTPTTLRRESRP